MHIPHRLKRLGAFFERHRVTCEALSMSAAMWLVLIIASDFPGQGHFLMRTTPKQGTPTARVETIADKRQLRIQKRKQHAIVRSVKNVAQETNNYLPVEPVVHRAAPIAIKHSQSSSDSSLPTEAPVGAKAGESSESSASPESSASSHSFPLFLHATHPVSRVPDWGAMTSPAQWNRTYKEMKDEDFVRVPAYDMGKLVTPMNDLLQDRNNPDSIKILTAKLYYSTRYFGAYDLDSGEFAAVHPAIDLKLPEGNPVGAIAGGRVHDVRRDKNSLGLHVIIEHRAPDGKTYYSIYGHLKSTSVSKGEEVTPGRMVGTVGMTGNTSGAHVHLQVDIGQPNEAYHTVYWPTSVPSRNEAALHAINPILFIRQFADGE